MMRNIKLLLKSLILCSTQLIKFVSDWQKKKKKWKNWKMSFACEKKKKWNTFKTFLQKPWTRHQDFLLRWSLNSDAMQEESRCFAQSETSLLFLVWQTKRAWWRREKIKTRNCTRKQTNEDGKQPKLKFKLKATKVSTGNITSGH